VIVVDTSGWIDYFRGDATAEADLLDDLIGRERIIVGDLVLCEILQGVASEEEARQAETVLREFELAQMLDPDLAVLAAGHYRGLRGKGVTVRKTIDLIIATFCLAHDLPLLHRDRDFDPISAHLGLKTIEPCQ
jgi:hypothetical protein